MSSEQDVENDSVDGAGGDEVEEIEIRLFLQAIFERYGYDLRDYSSFSIRRRVMGALARCGLAHLGELQHRVLTDPRTAA